MGDFGSMLSMSDSIHRTAPRQLVLFASQWTMAMGSFVRSYMSDPIFACTFPLEAAVYARVRQVRINYLGCCGRAAQGGGLKFYNLQNVSCDTCVFEQGTVITASLHPGVQILNGESWGVTCDGLASCPGIIEIFSVV